MMTVDERALFQLYQDIILDHHEAPRNFGELPKPQGSQEGFNPMCGDRVTVDVNVDQAKLKDIRFRGDGCSICMASASIMTEAVEGKTISDIHDSIESFRGLMNGSKQSEDFESEDIRALTGVRRFPVRIKCALLPWMTLRDAIAKAQSPAQPKTATTTEEQP